MIIDFIVLDFPGIKLLKEKKKRKQKKGVLIVVELDKENSNYVSSTTLVTRLTVFFSLPPPSFSLLSLALLTFSDDTRRDTIHNRHIGFN